MKRILLAVLAFTALSSVPAMAYLTLEGGLSFPSISSLKSPAPLVGLEYTFGLGSIFQIGPFFQNTFLTDNTLGGTSSLRFYGAVARFGLGAAPIVIDARVGLDQYTNISIAGTSIGTSDAAIGYGAGIGYKIWLGPVLDLIPHVGYRVMTTKFSFGPISSSSTDGYVDASLLLSFGF